MTTRRRPNLALWLAALVFTLAALAGTYIALVRTAAGQLLDERLMLAARDLITATPAAGDPLAVSASIPGAAAAGAATFLDYLPEASAVLAAIALLWAGLSRHSIFTPGTALTSALAAATMTQLLKSTLTRPDFGISATPMNSFPSGHTTVAASAMLAILLVSSPRLRPVVGTLGGIFAATAAVSTYVLGWHRPSDVIGAVLVSCAWALIAGWLILSREPGWNAWHSGRRSAPPGIWLVLPWVPAAVGIGMGVGIWFIVLRGEDAFTALSPWFAIAGLGLVFGATLAVFGAMVALLHQQTRVGS